MKIENKTLRRQRSPLMFKSPDGDVIRIKTERKGMGKLKAMLILFVALLQLCLLAALHLLFAAAFQSYLILSIVLDIVTCFYILGSSKNGRSKAVWIMIVLILFPVGFLIYFLSDEKIFFFFFRKRYGDILSASQGLVKGCGEEGMSEVTARSCAYLKNVTGYVPYKNTAARYFPSGAQAFDDMLVRCASARSFIFIEYFIIAEGALFTRLFDVLEERARAGVDVRVIYDDMGSNGRLSHKLKKQVRASGIKIYAFNRLVPLYKIGMNYRDHRKITVVDGETAYTGGINIADEYVNEKRMYGYWKDNAVRVDGDAVQGFTLMFLRQWEFVTKKPFDYSPFLQLKGVQREKDDGSVFLPYAAGLEYRDPVVRDMYANVISHADKKLYIMTPYFVPDETITDLLAGKARSGVDVRMVLPGIPDKKYVYLISLDNAYKLIKSGVKVYTMSDTFVHTKSVLTENCAVIGSANFDLRSFFQQYENALYTDDKDVMDGLARDFAAAFPESVQRKYIKRDVGFFRRLLTAILQIFAPMM